MANCERHNQMKKYSRKLYLPMKKQSPLGPNMALEAPRNSNHQRPTEASREFLRLDEI